VKHGIERFFSTAYQHQLADLWFPAVPGLVDKLTHGVRVADIGSGHGAATLLMARHWPRSSYTGFDSDPASIMVARSPRGRRRPSRKRDL
jgi:trans-aconitate methyltransferase